MCQSFSSLMVAPLKRTFSKITIQGERLGVGPNSWLLKQHYRNQHGDQLHSFMFSHITKSAISGTSQLRTPGANRCKDSTKFSSSIGWRAWHHLHCLSFHSCVRSPGWETQDLPTNPSKFERVSVHFTSKPNDWSRHATFISRRKLQISKSWRVNPIIFIWEERSLEGEVVEVENVQVWKAKRMVHPSSKKGPFFEILLRLTPMLFTAACVIATPSLQRLY